MDGEHRSRMLSTKSEPGGLGDSFIEILEFTHFAKVFQFHKVPENRPGGHKISLKKEISHGIKVSVVMKLV